MMLRVSVSLLFKPSPASKKGSVFGFGSVEAARQKDRLTDKQKGKRARSVPRIHVSSYKNNPKHLNPGSNN